MGGERAISRSAEVGERSSRSAEGGGRGHPGVCRWGRGDPGECGGGGEGVDSRSQVMGSRAEVYSILGESR